MFDGNDSEVNNIIHAGLIFILYLFIAIILYFVLSVPIELILSGIQGGATGTNAQGSMNLFMPGVRWGLNVAFALFLAFPVAWFVLWIFKQEPDFSMFKR